MKDFNTVTNQQGEIVKFIGKESFYTADTFLQHIWDKHAEVYKNYNNYDEFITDYFCRVESKTKDSVKVLVMEVGPPNWLYGRGICGDIYCNKVMFAREEYCKNKEGFAELMSQYNLPLYSPVCECYMVKNYDNEYKPNICSTLAWQEAEKETEGACKYFYCETV